MYTVLYQASDYVVTNGVNWIKAGFFLVSKAVVIFIFAIPFRLWSCNLLVQNRASLLCMMNVCLNLRVAYDRVIYYFRLLSCKDFCSSIVFRISYLSFLNVKLWGYYY